MARIHTSSVGGPTCSACCWGMLGGTQYCSRPSPLDHLVSPAPRTAAGGSRRHGVLGSRAHPVDPLCIHSGHHLCHLAMAEVRPRSMRVILCCASIRFRRACKTVRTLLVPWMPAGSPRCRCWVARRCSGPATDASTCLRRSRGARRCARAGWGKATGGHCPRNSMLGPAHSSKLGPMS